MCHIVPADFAHFFEKIHSTLLYVPCLPREAAHQKNLTFDAKKPVVIEEVSPADERDSSPAR
jgi:hypothetical protein